MAGNVRTGTQQPASPFVEQPANQAVPAGQPGHFAVMMSGTGPYTYQWQLGGKPIAGATNRIYDTAAAVAADSGKQYSVALFDVRTVPSGPVTATLYCRSEEH
ncbi:hypothetical protein ACR42A_35925, partial [Burkholderia gladioli]